MTTTNRSSAPRLVTCIAVGVQSQDKDLVGQRPLLARVPEGRDALDEALDRERRGFIRANQERLARYRRAAERWGAVWPEVAREELSRTTSAG